jgi:hypothetical protein
VPLTYQDLQETPEDGHRDELMDAMQLVTPAPLARHRAGVTTLVASRSG